jgi:hypothetical protein
MGPLNTVAGPHLLGAFPLSRRSLGEVISTLVAQAAPLSSRPTFRSQAANPPESTRRADFRRFVKAIAVTLADLYGLGVREMTTLPPLESQLPARWASNQASIRPQAAAAAAGL